LERSSKGDPLLSQNCQDTPKLLFDKIRGKLRVEVTEKPKVMVRFMRFRAVSIFFISCLIGVVNLLFTPPALALTQIKLSDISYHDCPSELANGAVMSTGASRAASCYIVTGKAHNESGKPVQNADIFGRIYDANGDSVMQNRTRLGSIEEVPPGVSDFELRISVSANQPTPLQLKQFKAAGFNGTVRR
jgi:hypothetical protein